MNDEIERIMSGLGFTLVKLMDTEDPEWRMQRLDGTPTAFVFRDWTEAGLGFAVIESGSLLIEGQTERQAINFVLNALRDEEDQSSQTRK